MFKSRLLLNDVPVPHENLFKIQCSRVIKFLSPTLFCYEEPLFCQRTELQPSGFYERAPWDSLCYRVFVQILVCVYKTLPYNNLVGS